MTSYLNIAWGNLLRNRRRTLSTLAAIGTGVSMIVVTNGLVDGISRSMSDSLVNQIDAHLRVEHRDYRKFSITDQEKILIKDYRSLATALTKNPHVRTVMPRVVTGGLLGRDDRSTTFFGAVYDLSTLTKVLPDYGKNLVRGQLLSEHDSDGVLVGQALAKSLALNVGDELVLLSKTVHGEQSNALVHVRGIITFPQDQATEQSLIVGAMGRSLKDNLLDLGDAATQLLVRLDDIDNVPEVEAALNRQFEQQGLPWRVVPWYESRSYSQLVGLFNGIGRAIMLVLTLMVGMITSNSLLMAFFERIREVGTLRAIGMRKMDVYQLLYAESAVLGAIGTASGLALGALLVLLGGYAGIPLGGFVNQEVHPTLSAASIVVSVAAPLSVIVVAASFPIRAASRMSVIQALNYQ